MMAILRVVIFILVQGFAVCDELYPISVLNDIAEDQLEGFLDNNELNLTQEKSDVQPNDPDIIDINWIKTNIVDRYGFVKKPDRDEWQTQPTFQGVLGTPDFISAAKRMETFFGPGRNNDWETTKKNPKYRTVGSCAKLLYITAARYLSVTHILYEQSILMSKKLIPCQRKVDKKIVIPASGMCYPAPPTGSATCTSDYDVSLAGIDSGSLIEKFNNYVQGVFKRPSDLVFDTNVYAFTLAYAFPSKFEGLPKNFAIEVAKIEKTVNFKMQELVSAYYKVFKYNPEFFQAMTTTAEEAMNPVKASQSKIKLNEWLDTFAALNTNVKMRIEGFQNSPQQLRVAHNAEYQRLVKEMSNQGGYKPALLGTLAKAELYAAEGYHTRGVIRVVVGGMQMGVLDTPPSTNDLWVSMIENWGESNKEYNHYGQTTPLEECLLKMSKYMWRMFSAMKLLLERIPPIHRPGLLHFDANDPEQTTKMWLDNKKQGMTAIPEHEALSVERFLLQFQCDKAVLGQPLSPDCISKINGKVNAYNRKLAALVTDD